MSYTFPGTLITHQVRQDRYITASHVSKRNLRYGRFSDFLLSFIHMTNTYCAASIVHVLSGHWEINVNKTDMVSAFMEIAVSSTVKKVPQTYPVCRSFDS